MKSFLQKPCKNWCQLFPTVQRLAKPRNVWLSANPGARWARFFREAMRDSPWNMLPSGKRLHNYGKSPFLMAKSTISMAIFYSYVCLPEGTTFTCREWTKSMATQKNHLALVAKSTSAWCENLPCCEPKSAGPNEHENQKGLKSTEKWNASFHDIIWRDVQSLIFPYCPHWNGNFMA